MNSSGKKPIFSIACTTCQAKLAIFSESAIGQIFECPRCHNLVKVAAPADWKPSPALPPASESGPPPLGRVAAGNAKIDLGITEPPTTGFFAKNKLAMLWLAVFLAVLVAVAVYWRHVSAARSKTVVPATAIVAKNADGDKSATTTSATAAKVATEPSASVKSSGSPAIPPSMLLPLWKKLLLGKSIVGPFDFVPPAEHRYGRFWMPPVETAEAETGMKIKPEDGKTKNIDEKQADEKQADEKQADSKKTEKSDNHQPTEKEQTPGKETQNAAGKPTPSIEYKKLPPPQIDLESRLNAKLRGIELNDVPLVRAFDLLSTLGGAPVTVDPDALLEIGVSPLNRVSMNLESVTFGRALNAMAERRGLAVSVDGQIVVTLSEAFREKVVVKRYDVADLVGDNQAAAEQFAAIVRRFAAPDSWESDKKQSKKVVCASGTLVVTQTGEVQQQVLSLVERLRNARQPLLRSQEQLARFSLVTRTQQAAKSLTRPISANFHEPATSATILAYLAEAANCVIMIDHAGLAAAETSALVETSLVVDRKPLAAVLTELLGPLGLAYRAVDGHVLQVTTLEAIDDRLELEFYPISTLLKDGQTPETFIKRLKAAVSPSTWNDAGGLGDVFYDDASKHLLILQSQPVQAAVERWLSKLGDDTKKR